MLELLWNMSRYEVGKNMILLNKSLVAQHVNGRSYTVLYGIHDLFCRRFRVQMRWGLRQFIQR